MIRDRRLSPSWCVVAALALPLDALAQGSPLGNEFQVNTYTPGNQFKGNQTVATDADGDFVIAWSSSNGQDGSGYGVFARRFSSAGAALASEFQVNTYTSDDQFVP